MLPKMLAPNTPAWLLIAVVIVFVVSLLALMGSALFLEIRYTSPYTLIKTTNRNMWRRAAILAFLQTAMIPIIGLAAPILSPLSDQWLFIPVCGGIWVVLLPLVTLYKRWKFDRHIKNYQHLDKLIKDKNGVYERLLSTPLTNWTRMLMTVDQQRFFRDGFPDNINQENDVEP